MCCVGWQSTHQICLANYGFSTSSNHVASTQNADYAGMSEAAGLPAQRSVTSKDVHCRTKQSLNGCKGLMRVILFDEMKGRKKKWHVRVLGHLYEPLARIMLLSGRNGPTLAK